MKCDNPICQNEAPHGFSFCSSDCTASLSQSALAVPVPKKNTEGLLKTREAAAKGGFSVASLHQWRASGVLSRSVQMINGECYFDWDIFIEEIREKGSVIAQRKLEAAIGRSEERKNYPPFQKKSAQPEPEKIPEIEHIRKRMLDAAKQSARDVILEAADRAKESGDHQLRAQLLEDFIHLEEGLKMTFCERASS